jgi:hypothetical protein
MGEMDLETFVSESLQQIIRGVRGAQDHFAKNPIDAKINPRGITALERSEEGVKQPHDLHTKLPIHQVEFDVAVTVSASSEGKGGVGIRVMGIAIGGEKASTTESSLVSRLKFSIPVVWPDPQTAGVVSAVPPQPVKNQA